MWPNPQKTADLVTFNDEILNGKLHFLCSADISHLCKKPKTVPAVNIYSITHLQYLQ